MFLTWKKRLGAVLGAVDVGGRGGFTTVKVPYPSPRQTSFDESFTNVKCIVCAITIPTNAHKCNKIIFIHTVNRYMFRPAVWPSSGV